jgi:hypothetical protein
MFTITNRRKNAVETSTAWANDDIENKHLYHAVLVRSFIRVDGDIMKRTYEWVVTKEDDKSFCYTVPLCFGFINRNCEIMKEEVVTNSEEPFAVNDATVKAVGDGYEVADENWKPFMVTFDGTSIIAI